MTKARDLANIISGGFDATDIPNLDTAKITSGTFTDARLPATALNSNVDLTNLSASNMTSGTLPDARFPATLPAVSGASLTNLPNTGITMVDMWRLTSNLVNPGNSHLIASNLERVDDAYAGFIGTGMSESSGVYTFPSTGIYRIGFFGHFYIPNGDDGACIVDTFVSSDSGSSYDVMSEAYAGTTMGGGQWYASHSSECFVDVTNASTFRVKFEAHSMAGCTLVGSTSTSTTYFTFTRLGDT